MMFAAPSNVPQTEDDELAGSLAQGGRPPAVGTLSPELPAPPVLDAAPPPLRFELQARDFPKAFDTVARQLVQAFAETSETPAVAAKSLLEALLLLRFLEVKGWLGEPDFLRRQLQLHWDADPDSQSFFQQVLAPRLRVLAATRLLPETDVVPPLPNRICKILTDTLFGPFRFTLQELSTKEAERLVDPEMLGVVSERELLERPLTLAQSAQTQRRISATFHTPRRIVRWMSREALLQYLLSKLAEFSQLDTAELRERLLAFFQLPPAAQMTDEHLAELNDLFLRAEAQRLSRALLACRVCDPAVGTGTLLAGMLEELSAALAKLDLQLYGRAIIQQHNYEFWLKRKLISECLFGVDVQERAVALCRQRLWLSLVACEQSVPDSSLAVTLRESVNVPGLFRHLVMGDSLLGCRAYEDGDSDSFKWRQAFPEVFQKRGGFDILICNPPYRPVLAKDSADKEVWAQIGALFPQVKRSKNVAAAFFDLPRLLGAPGVITCQMVPKSLTYSESWAATRAVLSLNYILLSAADVSDAFKEASLSQEVLIYSRDNERENWLSESPTDQSPVPTQNTNAPLRETYTLTGNEMLKVSEVPAPPGLPAQPLTPTGQELLERWQRLRTLGEFVTFKHGQRWQRRRVKSAADNPAQAAVPVIKGTHLRQFRITDELPRLEPPAYQQRVLEELRQPKLVCSATLAHLKKPHETLVLLCALDRSGAVALDSVQQIFLNQDCPYSIEFLCGLLNSSLARWFFFYVTGQQPAKALSFEDAQVGRLPLPRAGHRLVPQVEKLVRKLFKLELPRKYFMHGQLAEYDALDELLCEMYELSEEERREIWH